MTKIGGKCNHQFLSLSENLIKVPDTWKYIKEVTKINSLKKHRKRKLYKSKKNKMHEWGRNWNSHHVLCRLFWAEQHTRIFFWWLPPMKRKIIIEKHNLDKVSFFVVFCLMQCHTIAYSSLHWKNIYGKLQIEILMHTCSPKNSLSTKSAKCTSPFFEATCRKRNESPFYQF